MEEINKWLDSCVVDLPSEPHKPIYSDECYYTAYELEKFKSKKIDIHTKRNDANNIFSELVEHCTKYGINDKDGLSLINPSNKNSFYSFVYSNSSKSSK